MLDAGAFYAGTTFQSSTHQMHTTSAIIQEVEHIKKSFSALEALRDAGRLVVMDPGQKFVDSVVQAAAKTGDRAMLSEADISIISLALQLGRVLVTDDYSVANVASALCVAVKPATAGKEIKDTRRWIFYCSGCSRTYRHDKSECPLCGNKLKKKHRKLPSRQDGTLGSKVVTQNQDNSLSS